MFKRKKKKTYFEIGRDGTAEELVVANYRASSELDKYGYNFGYEQRQLQGGAIEGFKDGRPGNVQTIMSHLPDFNIRYSGGYIVKVSHTILSEITKGKEQDDAVAAIHLALANTFESEKQEALDDSLLLCMEKTGWASNDWKENLVAPLIAADADVNQNGKVLARAVQEDQPPFIIQQLYKAGASFDVALAYMKAHQDKYSARDIKNLNFYSTAAKAEQIIAELKETIAELTGKQPPAADPAQQRKIASARTPYPTL